MRIIDKIKQGTQFVDLNRGDCFIFDGDYFMKCDRNDLALNLELGLLCEFDPLEEVIPFDATLTAE